MKNVINDAVAKIKRGHIKPEPRWKYIIKKYGIWSVFAVIAILGALSLSVAYDMLLQLDWDLHRFVRQSFITYTLSMLPYLWLILIGIFLVIAFIDLRKTESGYKYSWLKISLITAGSVILIGIVFSIFGLGDRFNRMFAADFPYYGRHMMMTKERQWMQPEEGLLAGTIVSISENKIFLSDLNGQKWQISINEKTLIRPAVKLIQGEMIKIIGFKDDENNLQAIEVRPWNGLGMMNRRDRSNRMMNER